MKFLLNRLQRKLILRFILINIILLIIYSSVWISILLNQRTAFTLQDVLLFSALLLVTLIILGVLLSLTFTEGFIKAVNELMTGRKNFEQGNLDYRINIKTKDEIEDISATLNAIVGDLQKAYAKVEADKSIMKNEHDQMETTLHTEQQKLNYVMFSEREKVNYMLSAVTDGVIVLSKKRNVVLLNKIAEELTGYTAQEVINKPVNSVMKFFEKDREISWDEYAPVAESSAVKGGVYVQQRIRLEDPNIKPRYVNLTTLITKFSQSEDLGYILVIHNLSQEMQVEKMEMDFVTSVANELQQPLKLIAQSFDFLRQQNTDQQNIYYGGIQIGIDQLTLLLENLMTVTAVEQNSFGINAQPTDITAIIQQIVQDMKYQAAGRQLTLSFEVPKDPVSQCLADVNALRIVLLNLLMNAVIFTPSGGSVTVTVSQVDTDIFVHIQDTGVGIPGDAINNLFTKFYRIPNQMTNGQAGAGLGLYLSKNLIEMQKGNIWVDSVEGKGSTFSFSLPKA